MKFRATLDDMPLETSVRKIAAPLFLALVLCIPLAAEGFTLDISVWGGISFGQAEEKVWFNAEKEELLSLLTWPMLPVWRYGFELESRGPKGLFINGSVSAAVPAPSGTSTNEDWVDRPASAERTHFSSHEAHLETGFDAEIRAGWLFFFEDLFGPERSLSFIPSLGLRYGYWKWSAYNGSGDYPWGDEEFLGLVTSYSQETLVPLLSLEGRAAVHPRLELRLSYALSPIVSARAQDNHLLASKRVDYHDHFENQWFHRPTLSAAWLINAKTALFLEGEWLYIGGEPGDTYTIYVPASPVVGPAINGASMTFSQGSIRLGVRVSTSESTIKAIELPGGVVSF